MGCDYVILKRVSYGKKDTIIENREYQLEGNGPVGTLKEWEEAYPEQDFDVIK